MKLKRIINISRPRFWVYEIGTYVVGLTAGFVTFGYSGLSFAMIIFLLYFLFPGNLYIYGINDIHDYETDKLNPKKVEYEELVTPQDRSSLYLWIFFTNIPFIIYSFFIDFKVGFLFGLFLFFAGFYSCPPIRAKARPVLDSIFSASHYVVTGLFAYALVAQNFIVTQPMIFLTCAGLCWAISMHAYSAVPDIEADASAGLSTVATLLGRSKTIILCGILYALAGILAYGSLGLWSIVLTLPYLIMISKTYRVRHSLEEIFKLYKVFPTINMTIGFLLFLLTVSKIFLN